ncbi:MAG TPA: sulfotransferase [Acetobacteraceae bacterium]|nr:sulfotransferase [Acetobacteraceae bacterium]
MHNSSEPPALHNIVTVLGMHRSGTSLCANVLQAMGVNMAETPGVSPENVRGHWERAPINDLNDRVFAIFGRAWADASHVLALPEQWLADHKVLAVRDTLVAYLRSRVAGGRFGFKDPRTARLLPLWRQVFSALRARPRFVFCVRDPAQVARSLTARDHMVRAQSEYRWLIYNAAAIAGVGDDPVCIVPYEDWFTAPEATAWRLAAFVGAAAPSGDVLASVVDSRLRHDAPVSAPAGPLARRLHGMIAATAAEGGFPPDLVAFATSLEAFEQMVQPLLVDTEMLRASVAAQNRVIGDLTAALRQARHAA